MSDHQRFWDPSGGELNDDQVFKLQRDYSARLRDLEANLQKGRRKTSKALLFCVSMIILGYSLINTPLAPILAILSSIGIVVLVIVVPISLHYYWLVLPREILLRRVIQALGWLYISAQSHSPLEKLRIIYPEIFDRMTNVGVGQECWGVIPVQERSVPFWSCRFVVNDNILPSISQYIYAFRLPRKAVSDVLVVPRKASQNFRGIVGLKGREILEIEWGEFNRVFEIYTGHNRSVKDQDIYQVLDPNTLVHILESYRKFGPFAILIRGDAVIYVCQRPLLHFSYLELWRFHPKKMDQIAVQFLKKRFESKLVLLARIVREIDVVH